MRLADFAKVVRSKNAGPFLLTFDILFDGAEDLERVRASGALDKAAVAKAFAVSENAIIDFAYYPFAGAVKFSLRRAHSSGSRSDTDVYGAQQYSPLLAIELGLERAGAAPIATSI